MLARRRTSLVLAVVCTIFPLISLTRTTKADVLVSGQRKHEPDDKPIVPSEAHSEKKNARALEQRNHELKDKSPVPPERVPREGDLRTSEQHEHERDDKSPEPSEVRPREENIPASAEQVRERDSEPLPLPAPQGVQPTGGLQITTDVSIGGLWVYLDNRYIGSIPLSREVPEGKHTLTVTNGEKGELFDGEISIRQGRTLCLVSSYVLREALTDRSNRVEALRFSSDETMLASGGNYNGGLLVSGYYSQKSIIALWDTTDWSKIEETRRQDSICSLSFTEDNKVYAVGLGCKRKEMTIYSISRWDYTRELVSDPQDYVACGLLFNPGGGFIAAQEGYNNVITVMDASTFKEIKRFPAYNFTALAFSHDGKILVSASPYSNRGITVWDTHDWSKTKILDAGPTLSLCFSADGKMLAAGHPDGDIALWDTSEWKLLKTLRPPKGSSQINGEMHTHKRPLVRVSLRKNSKRELSKDLKGHFHYSYPIVFAPSGRTIASSHFNRPSIIDIWQLTLIEKDEKEEERELAKKRSAQGVLSSGW